MSVAPQPHLLDRVEEVEALVVELFDPARTQPVVVVTTRNGETEPLIDAGELARRLQQIPVRVLPTGPLTWELTGLLPEGMGAFGGAARIWWPGCRRTDKPYRHPLIFAYSKEEGARAVDRIVEEITSGNRARPGWTPTVAAPRSGPRPVAEGSTVAGTVGWATPGGAEVEVAPGCTGWLVRRRRDPGLAVGDVVEVRVVGYEDGAPVLERPPRTTAGPPARGFAVRPGPHLFRPQPGAPRPGAAPPEPAGAESLRARVVELERLLTEETEERLAAERRATAAENEAERAIRDLSRSAKELKSQLRSARESRPSVRRRADRARRDAAEPGAAPAAGQRGGRDRAAGAQRGRGQGLAGQPAEQHTGCPAAALLAAPRRRRGAVPGGRPRRPHHHLTPRWAAGRRRLPGSRAQSPRRYANCAHSDS